jgi:hypothetical protein
MPDFSSIIPHAHVRASRGFVYALIQTQREELLTGLMRLQYPSGENLVFTFLEGVQQKLYRCHEQNMEVIPRQSWSDSLDCPDASISILGLSVEGMRLLRVAYEAPILAVQQLNGNGDELLEYARLWASDRTPAIVHVQAEEISRIYLMGGGSPPVVEELVVTGSEAHFSLNDATFPKSLPPAEYAVRRYVSDSSHMAWQEYELRFAFHALLRALTHRFSELAGRMLTERLCEQLCFWIRDGGWNIHVTLGGLTDRHYFGSIEEARSANREIMQRFVFEASPAIGSRMADGISREALLQLDEQHQELLKRHVYDPHALDGTVPGIRRQVL